MLPPCATTVSSPSLAVVVGVVLIVIAVVYWVEPAKLAARLLPRARGGLGPPPREARHRGVPRRARLPRLRLVPDRPEAHAPPHVIVAELITYPQAIVLGLLQGVSELFPVSSLGHSVILPSLLGWDIHQNDKYFLTFLVATHLATAIVLLGFFWRDWVRILRGLGRSLRDRGIAPDDTDAKLGWLLVVGTIPAGMLGLTLEHSLRKVFASPTSAAIFLTAERRPALRRRAAAPARARQADEDDDARIAQHRHLAWRVRRRRGAGARADPRASPARARRWAAACSSASRTRTRRGSRSCSRRRSSAPPRC